MFFEDKLRVIYDVLIYLFIIIIIILLYNIVLVLPYINMHPPRVYTCTPWGRKESTRLSDFTFTFLLAV